MMKNISVEWHESGLILGQEGVSDCVVVPNLLKVNFYETLLTACLTGEHVSWSDLDGNRLLMNYEYKNNFNTFLNGQYVGDLPYVLLNENSVAIPIETNGEEQVYEVYDSTLMESYLLYHSELF